MMKRIIAILLALLLTAGSGGALADRPVLPANCTRIEEAAFQNCVRLKGALTIPEGVEEIGDYAFSGCTGLTGVPVIPGTVRRIGAHAFDGCAGLSGRLVLPDGLTVDEAAFANCPWLTVVRKTESLHVAVVADMGGFQPGTFNAMAYEPAKAWCEQNGGVFKSYVAEEGKEAGTLKKAIEAGADVVILTGFEFQDAMDAAQKEYPDVRLVGLDMSADYLQSGVGNNVFLASYREDLSGFMAGYAAVKLGYTHLGFLGGIDIPPVQRYGSGFVQGANQAAKALKQTGDVVVEYACAGTFAPEPRITDQMKNWYEELGVQAVFACGGGIYSAVAEAAKQARAADIDAKIIGVDVDQAGAIDGAYGKGMTLTSAMKGLDATVLYVLNRIAEGEWQTLGGKAEVLGMNSAVPEENFTQIAPSTQFNDGFTYDDYKTLVSNLLTGAYSTEGDVEITVNDK